MPDENGLLLPVDFDTSEAEQAVKRIEKSLKETHNLVVAEGVEFKSINEILNKIREEAEKNKREQDRLTEAYGEQNELLQRKKAILESLRSSGTPDESEISQKLIAEISSAETVADRLAEELDAARTRVYDLEQAFTKISQMPLEYDLEGFEKAKYDAKQLENVVKNIKETSSEVSFPQMSLDVSDSKLKSLIANYNSLASTYQKTSNNVVTLRNRINELRAEEEKYKSNGELVPSYVTSQLTEYNAKLEEAKTQLSTIGVKTEQARDKVTEYAAELERSGTVAYKVGSATTALFSRLSSGFEKVVTRIKNMIFRFVVMRTLYAAFNSLKNIMSAINSQNSSLQNSFNQLKSTLLVGFYPLIDLMSRGLERLVGWLTQAAQWVAAFIHAVTGADINNSIKKARELYNAMNAEANAKAEKAAIDKKIKAKQKEVKELEKQQKALKREYDHEKQLIEDKKKALDDEIDAVNATIKALRRQEEAEKKAAKALKDSIQIQIDALNDKKKSRKEELDAERDALSEQIKAIDKQIKALEKQKKLREEAIKGEEKYLASFDTLQTLGGAEEEDPEVKAIEDQIQALNEKKDALNEVKDAIPSDSDDPLIKSIEAQIDALERQKKAIQDVDYSAQIQAQQDLIDKYDEQKDALDKIADKLDKEYTLKVEGLEDAKQDIQEAVQELQEVKQGIEDTQKVSKQPLEFDTKGIEGITKKIEIVSKKLGWLIDLIQSAKDWFSGAFNLIAETAKKWAKRIKEWADETGITDKLKTLKTAFEKTGEAFSNLVKVFVDEWNKPASDRSSLACALHGIASLISGAFAGIVDTIVQASIDILDVLSSLATALKGLVDGDYTEFANGLIGVFTGIGDAIIDIFAGVVKTVVRAIYGLLKAIAIKNELKVLLDLSERSVLDWIDELTKKWKGTDPYGVPSPDLPSINPTGLAAGAVLPGGKPFLAMLGDQPAGQTNIETPEKLLRQIVREELSTMNSGTDVTINFEGSMSQLARILQPHIEVANKRASAYA